jgi:hypothetical protein
LKIHNNLQEKAMKNHNFLSNLKIKKRFRVEKELDPIEEDLDDFKDN